MAKKRERLEIIQDILRVVRDNKNSIKPTPLLRYSNLSSKSFNQYFSELKEKKFLKEIETNGKTFISLTDKGFKYLEKYKKILKFIDEFNL